MRRPCAPAVAAALAAAVLVAVLASAGAKEPRIGDAFPEFDTVALDGERISFADAARTHKAVVVVFLSTVCPYANSFSGHIAELARRHRDVLFVGVNSNQSETAEEVAEHAKTHGLTFPVVRDEAARLADLLGAKRTPEAFLVDAQGRLRYHGWVQSKLRSPDLQRALDAVLAGAPVRLAETKAFGCAIDRNR